MSGASGAGLDPVNAPAAFIRRENVLYTGTARRHHVAPFAGSVSIKSTLRGSAIWEADSRRYVVTEGTWLLLDEGQQYTLTIDARLPVTTFCLFFRSGFVEDALRTARSDEARLLDDPFADPNRLPLPPGLRPRTLALSTLLDSMHHRSQDGRAPEDWEKYFICAASLLAGEALKQERGQTRLLSVKSATREELSRRVQRGLDFMLSHLGDRLTTEAIAREACLSLFHFHRAFALIHGSTPHRFLTQQRLLRAADLLRHTSASVGEISRAVGFERPSSFTALFARRFGRSPLAYRLGR